MFPSIRHPLLAILLLASSGLTPVMLSAQGDPARFQDLRYRSVGPSRGGRVTAVAGVASRPGTFYFGSTGGGVWTSTDYGTTWRNLSDRFFASPSIGAIAVAPSDADRLYVGTGSDGIRSNIIVGKGVYRSDDAGATWRHVGLPRAGLIGAVLVHPRNPDLVYVAAIGQPHGPNRERGVYRSRDGGGSWEQVLFVSDSTGAVDLEFAPDNPEEIYASLWRTERKPWTIISGAREGGVYKSRDGGTTWTRLRGGLPEGLVGKSDLAVSPVDPNRLWVLIEAEPGGGLYRSDDRGASFRLVSTQSGLLDRPFYYTNVDASPVNADELFVSATAFWHSTDAGLTWRRRSTPHGDNHDLWIDPTDPRAWIQANDGGVNVTRDAGATWSTQLNQPTAELYQVAVDDRFPYWLYAGQQDNTTIAVPSLPPYPSPGGPQGWWRETGGCETGPAVPKPGDPDIVYANCKGRFGRYNARTGQEQQYYVGAANLYGANPRDLTYRFQRVVPIHVSPHDPNTVYHASQFLHRTRDEGVTWETISPDLTAFDPERQVISGAPITRDITGEEYYSTIYTVKESEVERGVIWVGANDGPISVTRDDGQTWTRVTPSALPPGGRVQTVEPSPHRAGKAYAAILRNQLDDWEPYLFRTDDYGSTWTRLTTGTNGLPGDYPVRVVREDPEREGVLYAGTEFGMYVSLDDGVRWHPLQHNLPVTPVTDLTVVQGDLVLSTMGRGFWILDDLTPIREAASGSADSPALLTPRPAVRMRYSARRSDPADPEFPPPGAVIDYVLPPGEFVDPLTLEILDDRGTLIRRFSRADRPGQPATPPQGMRAPPGRAPAPGVLGTEAGHNRFRWDLTWPGPENGQGRPVGSGPLATPGEYQIRITAGAWSSSVPLTVELDPRVEAEGVTDAQMEEQLEVALTVRDLLTSARALAARARTARTSAGDTSDVGRTLGEALAELETADQTYPRPMLIDQISYLYRMVTAADQELGRDAHARLEELDRWYRRLEAVVRRALGVVS